MSAPRVSVISAWYNRPEDLDMSVRSVLDQGDVDLEYIVLDDASDDEATWQALQAVNDPRLRLQRNESNIGFTRSMRKAASMARGDYIAVHDAGDISLPGRFAAQTAFLDTHPDHVAVGVRVRTHDLTTGRVELFPLREAGRGPSYPRFTHGEVMFRRDAYEAAAGYRDVFYFAQDVDLWRRLSGLGKMTVIGHEVPLYERRVFAKGVAGDPAKAVAQAVFANLGWYAAQSRREGRGDPVARRHALALLQQMPRLQFLRRSQQVVFGLMKAGRWREAREVISVVPAGMLSGKLALANAVLTLLYPRRFPDE